MLSFHSLILKTCLDVEIKVYKEVNTVHQDNLQERYPIYCSLYQQDAMEVEGQIGYVVCGCSEASCAIAVYTPYTLYKLENPKPYTIYINSIKPYITLKPYKHIIDRRATFIQLPVFSYIPRLGGIGRCSASDWHCRLVLRRMGGRKGMLGKLKGFVRCYC